MDWHKVVDVLVICMPVFAVMGIGKLLDVRGWMNADHRKFINALIYYIALPSLIFNAVAQQRFSQFLNPALLLPALIGVAVLTILFTIVAKLNRYRGGFASAVVFGTFWANVTYMGFPLAKNAFGDEGLALAAVYNAFVMPAFIIMGFLLIAVHTKAPGDRWTSKLKETFSNPIILAAFAGIIVASIGEIFRGDDGALAVHPIAIAFFQLSDSFLKLIGSMGLPLALLTIGASLHLGKVKEHKWALLMVLTGKLILMPLITLLAARYIFPSAPAKTVAVAVLLGATPNAVASYVIACKTGADEGFVSSLLVLSTALSIITIPTWLYFVM
jgi:predicted permease